MILWFKRHWQSVFALCRYKKDQNFLAENFWKMSIARVRKFLQFPVKVWPPWRSFGCIFYDSGGKSWFRHSGDRFILSFLNMVKNDKNWKKATNMPIFGWFEHLIKTFWWKTTFTSILKPFRSKKVNFRNFSNFSGFHCSKGTILEIWPPAPIFDQTNLLQWSLHKLKAIS